MRQEIRLRVSRARYLARRPSSSRSRSRSWPQYRRRNRTSSRGVRRTRSAIHFSYDRRRRARFLKRSVVESSTTNRPPSKSRTFRISPSGPRSSTRLLTLRSACRNPAWCMARTRSAHITRRPRRRSRDAQIGARSRRFWAPASSRVTTACARNRQAARRDPAASTSGVGTPARCSRAAASTWRSARPSPRYNPPSRGPSNPPRRHLFPTARRPARQKRTIGPRPDPVAPCLAPEPERRKSASPFSMRAAHSARVFQTPLGERILT